MTRHDARGRENEPRVSLATVSRVQTVPSTSLRARDAARWKSSKSSQRLQNVHARRVGDRAQRLFPVWLFRDRKSVFSRSLRVSGGRRGNRGFDALLQHRIRSYRTKTVIRAAGESDVRGVAIITSSVERSLTTEADRRGISLVFFNSDRPNKERGISVSI